jgi:hypothetical protein
MGRIIEKSLRSSVQIRNEVKWLRFLREKGLSFFQGVLKTVVLKNSKDEDDLQVFQGLKQSISPTPLG